MDWFLDGVGQFVAGLLVGGGAGSVVTWRVTSTRTRTKQAQKAGNDSKQSQVGRDVNKQGDTRG